MNYNITKGYKYILVYEFSMNAPRSTDVLLDGQDSQNNSNQTLEQQSPNQQTFPIQQQGTNPFASMIQNQMPDVPIQNNPGMSELLLGDTDVPKDIREKYWFIFNKDNVLTFLDEERKRSKLLNHDVIKIDVLNSTPYYDYNFDLEMEWDILRNTYETKLDRALGFKNDTIKNERIVLQSQFSESKQVVEQSNGIGEKSGFFKRLMGKR